MADETAVGPEQPTDREIVESPETTPAAEEENLTFGEARLKFIAEQKAK